MIVHEGLIVPSKSPKANVKVVLYSKKVMLGCKSHFFLNGKILNLKHLGMLS